MGDADQRIKAATYLDGLASVTGIVPVGGIAKTGLEMAGELLRTVAMGIRAGRMDKAALLRVIDDHSTIRAPDFSAADAGFESRVPVPDEDTKP